MEDREDRALLVEDDPSALRSLTRLLTEAGFSVCQSKTYAEGKAAIEEAASARRRFALMLLDLRLPDGDGKQLVPLARRLHPLARILVVSGFLDEKATRWIEASGGDACEKPFGRQKLLDALGARDLHREAGRQVESFAEALGLTGRERAVLHLLARGRSPRDIARALVISVRTVETYVRRICEKSGCRSRDEILAALLAHRAAPAPAEPAPPPPTSGMRGDLDEPKG